MAKRSSASSRKAHTLVKRRLFHAQEYWRSQNDRYVRLMDFCLWLEHYRQGETLSKDRRRIQPKTQRQFNLIRHKASLLLRQEPQFDTHATQPGADSAAAEVSKRIIEGIFKDPLKAYHDPRSRMVWSALAGGRGNIAIDWHQKWGVCFRFADPTRVHITPGWTFMHDPRNPSVFEEVPMRLSEVRAMRGWDVPSDLTGDGGRQDHAGASREADGIERDQGSHLPSGEESDKEDPVVTVCKAWFREDPFQSNVKALRNADLPEDEWFFIDDETQMMLPFDPMNPTPPVGPGGQPMRLITNEAEMNSDKYDDGVLIITAPYYAGGTPLFEGKWLDGAINPKASMPTFPYMEMVGYKNPLTRTGISDTELTHALTIVDNSTFRSTFEQTSLSGGIFIQPKSGLTDSEGNAFRLTSDAVNNAYVDGVLAKEMIDFKQFPGMNPTMPAFRDMIDNQWQQIGTGDFAGSLGPERSKDIAVGTANLIQQTGDLPVQLHAQDLGLQEAIGATCVLALCSAYMGDQVISWVTDEGDIAYANVRGSDLVPMNVTVKTDSEWNQKDTDRAQATAQLMSALAPLGLPPNVMAAILRESKVLSPSVAAELAAGMMPPAGPPPGAGTGGGPDTGAAPPAPGTQPGPPVSGLAQ
jgi:hypothetical protein